MWLQYTHACTASPLQHIKSSQLQMLTANWNCRGQVTASMTQHNYKHMNKYALDKFQNRQAQINAQTQVKPYTNCLNESKANGTNSQLKCKRSSHWLNSNAEHKGSNDQVHKGSGTNYIKEPDHKSKQWPGKTSTCMQQWKASVKLKATQHWRLQI